MCTYISNAYIYIPCRVTGCPSFDVDREVSWDAGHLVLKPGKFGADPDVLGILDPPPDEQGCCILTKKCLDGASDGFAD